MKRLLLYCLALINVLPAVSYNYPELWEKKELKLIEKQDLTSILDAGIRPYRFPSFEKIQMSFKHVNLRLNDDVITPYFPVEEANMLLFKPGFLKKLTLRSRRMTTEEGEIELMKWVHLSNKTEQDVTDYFEELEAFAKSQSFKTPPSFRLGTLIEKNGYRVGYGVKPTRGYYDPLRIILTITWKPFKTSKEYELFDGPIPPPDGYEHLSFGAPKKFGPDSLRDVLNYKQEYANLKGLPMPAEYEMPPVKRNESIVEKPKDLKPVIETPQDKPSRLWWTIGIVALLAVAFWLLKGKKSA